MKLLRLTAILFAAAGLLGWLWLRKPHTPADDLPPITISTFSIDAASPEAGQAFALAAKQWPGVTATTYNTTSGLLAVVHTAQVTEPALQEHISLLAGRTVEKKVFDKPVGPECPVPHAMLAKLPGILLCIGLLGAGLFLLTLGKSRTSIASPNTLLL